MKSESEKSLQCDMYPPLNIEQAKIEAQRCYFCHDAPCIEACPTDIDIPGFIRKIATDNVKGSAVTIFSQNILGGTCARVCPVESLCEGACVRNTAEDKPVAIGQLQRFATDAFMKQNHPHPFKRAESSGKKVAVVGAGPAGLSCAHRLAMLGHQVIVYEAKDKPGGLNEYGIAAYKMVDDFAQKEVDFIRQIGGIEIKCNQKLGRDFSLKDLQKKHDAVFLAFGLSGVNALEIPGENLPNVIDAVDYIARLRQTKNFSGFPVGRNIVVIGGGSTAIDVAVQSKRLGAQTVTLVYRRGEEDMSATWKEREFAQTNGVAIKTWARPKKIIGEKSVQSVEFEYTGEDNKGEAFTLPADMVFKAIGQKLVLPDPSLDQANKKIPVDEKTFQTSLPGVFAGGDCVFDKDLTVVAVRHGKLAAQSIDLYLRGKNG